MAEKLNKEQTQAITVQNKNILVSAPAGSGKTKILISRIMRLIEEENYNINELLILTFTKAAASEMRQRLNEAITKKLQGPFPNSSLKKHFQKQTELINQAYITNFHGFCSTILKQYGYQIGINNDFKIIEDSLLIKDKILNKLLPAWISDPDYQDFIRTYYGTDFKSLLSDLKYLANLKANNNEFKSLINNKTITFEEYIQENYVSLKNASSYQDWLYSSELLKIISQELDYAEANYQLFNSYLELKNITTFDNKPKGKASNRDLLDEYLSELKAVISTKNLDKIRSAILDTHPVFNRNTLKNLTKTEKDTFSKLQKNITKDLKDTAKDLIAENFTVFQQNMLISYQGIQKLLSLYQQYAEEFQAYKQKKNLLDFNDLEEQMRILLQKSPETKKILHNQLKEIMIDEYQDTSHIQENMINEIAEGSEREVYRFLVGDMKQAIYRFREADLKIFGDKFIKYQSSPDQIRIDLIANYRSHKTILDNINWIFNQIMDQNVGGLEYYQDKSAQLHYGFKEDDQNQELEKMKQDSDLETELLLVTDDKTSDKIENEAIIVADRILQLIDQGYKYQDIAVLMSTSSNFITYKQVFARYNIPCDITLNKGYLQAPEILSTLAALQAINNPNDEIALTSLLFGNYRFSHLNEGDLLELQQTDPDNRESFYEKLKTSSNPKIKTFLSHYHKLQEYSKSHYPSELLEQFLADADYPVFLSGLLNGKQRLNNLRKLLVDFQNKNHLSLNLILNEYRQQIDQGYDVVPAANHFSNNNIVRFMTIHKSKGLEFKVVFVADLNKNKNKLSVSKKLLFDHYYGLYLKPHYLSQDQTWQEVTLTSSTKEYANFIKYKINKEERDEKMRLLYVALTRAKTKLILTSSITEKDILDAQLQAILSSYQDPSSPLIHRQARLKENFINWILVSLVRHPDFINQLKDQQIFQYEPDPEISSLIQEQNDKLQIHNLQLKDPDSLTSFLIKIYNPENILEITKALNKKKTISLNIPQTLQKYQGYQTPYPVADIPENYRTVAVTQIVADGDRNYNFLADQEAEPLLSATDRGTLIHSFLENLPLKKDLDLNTEIIKLEDLYTPIQLQVIRDYQPKLQNFINSPIYQMMLNSDHLYKEKKFSYKLNSQIIHGIFDVVIIKDNTVTVLDYKTDRLTPDVDDQSLIQAHEGQMTYYINLLRKIFPDYQINALLYYLELNRYVTI